MHLWHCYNHHPPHRPQHRVEDTARGGTRIPPPPAPSSRAIFSFGPKCRQSCRNDRRPCRIRAAAAAAAVPSDPARWAAHRRCSWPSLAACFDFGTCFGRSSSGPYWPSSGTTVRVGADAAGAASGRSAFGGGCDCCFRCRFRTKPVPRPSRRGGTCPRTAAGSTSLGRRSAHVSAPTATSPR